MLLFFALVFITNLTQILSRGPMYTYTQWSRACAPLLTLSVGSNLVIHPPPRSLSLLFQRQLPTPSNPEVRYLTFICCQCCDTTSKTCPKVSLIPVYSKLVIVLRIRRGKNADSLDEAEHTARSIQAQLDDEFVDKGNGQIKSNSRSLARRLRLVIDEHTPM